MASSCLSMCVVFFCFRPDAHPCMTKDLAFRFLIAFPVLIETPDVCKVLRPKAFRVFCPDNVESVFIKV